MEENRYFHSPQEAVKKISALLSKEEWEMIALYYDLTGTGITREELISSDFFIRKEPPPGAHPGGFWKYKQPFAPGFTYSYHIEDDNNRVEVHLQIKIDEGDGFVQQGVHSFYMRKSDNGYQILPAGF